MEIYKNIKIGNYLPVGTSKVCVVIDKNLESYKELFSEYEIIEVEVSEKLKNLQTVSELIDRFLQLGLDRKAFIVGVGGGILTDVVGFVASIYKRGLKFGFIPSTLLSQVDAAIGGKNGVNSEYYKNVIGVFRQPEWIVLSPLFLNTLSERELRSGLSEMLKTFLIFEPHAYNTLVKMFSSIDLKNLSQENMEELSGFISKCASYKMEMVRRDEFEKGERRLLNLGHTFGHAIEKCTDKYTHGEAVALGMIISAKISENMQGGCSDPCLSEKLTQDFNSIGLPTELDFNKECIFKAVLNDKKVVQNEIYFSRPYSIGDVRVEKIDIEKLKEAYYALS